MLTFLVLATHVNGAFAQHDLACNNQVSYTEVLSFSTSQLK